MTEKQVSEHKAWIFQGNPLRFRVYDSLLDENIKEDTWLVSRYRDEIHIGDTALIWKARQASGIYAVGKVISTPKLMHDSPQSRMYWIHESDKDEKAIRVWIRYELRLSLINHLTSKELNAISGLRNMEIFKIREGTNFRVKSSEWQIINELLVKKYNYHQI